MNKVLNFFALLDSEGRLSLTAVGTYVMLIKIAIIPEPSVTDLGALLLALLNYAHKRHVTSQLPKQVTSALDPKQIEDLTSKVNALAIRVGLGGK